MRKIIVKIDKEKATELERVNFELNFVKDIVQRVIESHPSDLELINGDTLMSYNKRGAELQRKYAALANEMEICDLEDRKQSLNYQRLHTNFVNHQDLQAERSLHYKGNRRNHVQKSKFCSKK